MHKAVDKFNLHDDEWMMVEDELLSTAKLFTRHLHLAEYERLKRNIQKDKNVIRPVIPNTKPSQEGQIRQRAEAHAKAQKKALRDVFGSTGDRVLFPPKQAVTTKAPNPIPKARTKARPSLLGIASREIQSAKHITTAPMGPSSNLSGGSDSDDLDVPRGASKDSKHPGSFTKPTLPSRSQRSSSRPIRKTPFDYLDESESGPKRLTSPTKALQSSTDASISEPLQFSSGEPNIFQSKKSSFNILDELDIPKRESESKKQGDRLAKRKSERDKDTEWEKRKSVKLDDIPTFLF